jgi:hypothetical protein
MAGGAMRYNRMSLSCTDAMLRRRRIQSQSRHSAAAETNQYQCKCPYAGKAHSASFLSILGSPFFELLDRRS